MSPDCVGDLPGALAAMTSDGAVGRPSAGGSGHKEGSGSPSGELCSCLVHDDSFFTLDFNSGVGVSW